AVDRRPHPLGVAGRLDEAVEGPVPLHPLGAGEERPGLPGAGLEVPDVEGALVEPLADLSDLGVHLLVSHYRPTTDGMGSAGSRGAAGSALILATAPPNSPAECDRAAARRVA